MFGSSREKSLLRNFLLAKNHVSFSTTDPVDQKTFLPYCRICLRRMAKQERSRDQVCDGWAMESVGNDGIHSDLTDPSFIAEVGYKAEGFLKNLRPVSKRHTSDIK